MERREEAGMGMGMLEDTEKEKLFDGLRLLGVTARDYAEALEARARTVAKSGEDCCRGSL